MAKGGSWSRFTHKFEQNSRVTFWISHCRRNLRETKFSRPNTSNSRITHTSWNKSRVTCIQVFTNHVFFSNFHASRSSFSPYHVSRINTLPPSIECKPTKSVSSNTRGKCVWPLFCVWLWFWHVVLLLIKTLNWVKLISTTNCYVRQLKITEANERSLMICWWSSCNPISSQWQMDSCQYHVNSTRVALGWV